MDYKARMHDPLLGRCIQPDTVVPNHADLQSWNRYSYVQNDPVLLVDPAGHEPNWKLRGLKRDYGRYWDEVKAAGHREGDGALDMRAKSMESAEQQTQFEAQLGALQAEMWQLMQRTAPPAPCAALDGGFSMKLGALSYAGAPPRGPFTPAFDPMDSDYHQIAVGLGGPYGLTAALTWDRYGDTFLGAGVHGGARVVFTAYDTSGWIGSNRDYRYPSRLESISFLSKLTVNGSAGFVAGFGITYSPGSLAAKWGFKQGFYSFQAQISAMYSFQIP